MTKMRYGVFGFQQTDRPKVDKTVIRDGVEVIHEVGEYRSDDWDTYQETVKVGEKWLDDNVPKWRGIRVE